jgi:hypothetical protein
MFYEKAEGHLQEQFDWWPQAEAVVGFFNTFQITGDKKYLAQCKKAGSLFRNTSSTKRMVNGSGELVLT